MRTMNVLIVLSIVTIILGTVGWGLNIVKLCQCDFEAPYKAEVVRAIGIPIPLVGAVAGWCDIDDGPSSPTE